ncbi:MAG: SDR family oxidoreductase [Mycobacteriales bacterium]
MLGGTSFVGRAIAADALAAGHEVTLFGRGRTGSELFPGVARLVGDRTSGDYASLGEGSWDAVVDVSGYVPRHVRQAADALGDRVGRYLFISTGSVYDRTQASDGMTEGAARLAPERGTEDIDGDTYGPLKVACEDDVCERYGDAATIVRPGIVAGPYDPTDRFTYWVRRAARGGRVAVPGRLDQPVQVVDSRDLGRLVVALLEAASPGIFNAVGPADAVSLEQAIRACAAAAGSQVELEPVATVQGFPLVLPDESWDVMFRRSAARAHKAGMPTTPLEKTAADVLEWDTERGRPPLSVGLTPEQENELLAR